jgi:hypothetical protein
MAAATKAGADETSAASHGDRAALQANMLRIRDIPAHILASGQT